jgi:hypothetical protein
MVNREADHPHEAFRSFQSFKACPEVDVVSGSSEDQRRHGLNSRRRCLSDTTLLLSEMYYFDIKPLRVECGCNVLFGGHAHGATGMVEDSFGFHLIGFFSFCSPQESRCSSTIAPH